MIRTPKEWTETCLDCGGSGKVHKRESFALLTPDEYMRLGSGRSEAPALSDKYGMPAGGLPTDAVVCWAGNTTIFEACKEGVELAAAMGHPIAFEFNEHVVVCRAGDNPDAVAKEWWQRCHGETYEQTAAKR